MSVVLPIVNDILNQPGATVIQPKLTVNRPGDRYEQEADQIADQVMRMTASSKWASYEFESKEELHRKEGGRSGSGIEVPQSVHHVTNTPGQPLDPVARSFFEPRFGQDLSHVQVHADQQAAESAAEVGARAYSVGRHIAFGAHEYQPGTSDGRRLIAHELAHTFQQSSQGQVRLARLGPSHIDLSLDPTSPEEFLQRLKDFMDQTVAEDLKRGGLPDPGHVEKIENALKQVKSAEKEGKISKSVSRAARNIVAKRGGPRMSDVLRHARFKKIVARRLARVAASKTAKRAASLIPLVGWAFSANDAWSGVKDIVDGHVARGLAGVSCAAADVASDFVHAGDAVSGVGGTALSLGIQAGTITCQVVLDVQRVKDKMDRLEEVIRRGEDLPPEAALREQFEFDDESIEELKDNSREDQEDRREEKVPTPSSPKFDKPAPTQKSEFDPTMPMV